MCGGLTNSSLPYSAATESFLPVDIQVKVEVKTSSALIIQNVLHLPIHRIYEFSSSGLSCSEKSILEDCEITCESNRLDFRLQKIPEQDNSYSGIFWSYAFLVMINWIAMAVVTSVADALCFQTLGKHQRIYLPSNHGHTFMFPIPKQGLRPTCMDFKGNGEPLGGVPFLYWQEFWWINLAKALSLRIILHVST